MHFPVQIAIACWASRDPIGEAGGLNLYLALGNSPVEYIDELGLWWVRFESGGKEVRTVDDIQVEHEGSGGEFTASVDFKIDPVTQKVPPEPKDHTSDAWFNWVASLPPPCIVYVRPHIRCQAQDDVLTEGNKIRYRKHYVQGQEMFGGKGFGEVAEEVLLHEKAHAGVWVEKTKTCFENKLKKYGDTGQRPLTKQEQEELKQAYQDCWKQSVQLSADRANTVTLGYYDSRPQTYRRVFPNSQSKVPYDERYQDPTTKDFIDATDVWQTLGK